MDYMQAGTGIREKKSVEKERDYCRISNVLSFSWFGYKYHLIPKSFMTLNWPIYKKKKIY